ncbi:MAG: hypothetical protein JWM74_1444 [Myxococcaceae bacterium]|nr:hypothetical protein [Myxococcaceae bacterium]
MKRSRAVLAAVVSLLFVTGSASAQSTGATELAQKRFEEGRKLMTEGKLAEACAKFAESDRAAPNGGAVMNLADCLEKRSQWEEAHAKFIEAAQRAAEAQRPEIEAVARDRAKKLEPHLPPPAAAPSPAPAPARVEPPPTRVEPTGVEPGPTPVEPPHKPEASPEKPSNGSTQRVLGLSAAGAGVIALGVGTVFALSASSKRSDVEAACPGGRCRDQAFVTMNDDAKSSADTATIFFVVGGVLAAGGAAIYFTAPSGSARASAAATRPRLGAFALPGGGAATLGGSW